MAAEAETRNPPPPPNSTPPVGKETLIGGGEFLGNSVGVCAGKQMLPTIAALEKS